MYIPVKFYKPNHKDQTKGSAFRLDFRPAVKVMDTDKPKTAKGAVPYHFEEGCVFMAIAKQNGEKSFDWSDEQRLAVKINAGELAKFVDSIDHQLPLDLVHKAGGRDSSKTTNIKTEFSVYQDKTYMRLSIYLTDGDVKRGANFSFGESEIVLLNQLFKRYMVDVYLLND